MVSEHAHDAYDVYDVMYKYIHTKQKNPYVLGLHEVL